MSEKEQKKETAGKDNCLALQVSKEDLESIRTGATTSYTITLEDCNYRDLIMNIDGNILILADEMPTTFHGCHWWNNGNFPYGMKDELQYLLFFVNRRDVVKVEIESIKPIVGHRFRFGKKPGEESVLDPNGDSCIWNLEFNFKVVNEDDEAAKETEEEKQKVYLLRWNPAISSFKIEDYRGAMKAHPNGFYANWSVYEWENAHEGDRYYMIRVGEGNTGIVFQGEFMTEPWVDDDWAGTSKQRHYMDITCVDCKPDTEKPWLTIDELNQAIPEINWNKGHSGQLLPEEIADRLDDLWDEAMKKNALSKQQD